MCLTLPTHRHQLTILAADSGSSLYSSSTHTCCPCTLTQLRPLPPHSFPNWAWTPQTGNPQTASFPSTLLHLPMGLSLPQAETAQVQHLPPLAFLAKCHLQADFQDRSSMPWICFITIFCTWCFKPLPSGYAAHKRHVLPRSLYPLCLN